MEGEAVKAAMAVAIAAPALFASTHGATHGADITQWDGVVDALGLPHNVATELLTTHMDDIHS